MLANCKLLQKLMYRTIIICEVKEYFFRITFPIHERMIDHRFRGCSGLSGMTDLRLRLGDSPSPFCAASAFIWTNLFISTKDFCLFRSEQYLSDFKGKNRKENINTVKIKKWQKATSVRGKTFKFFDRLERHGSVFSRSKLRRWTHNRKTSRHWKNWPWK